MSIRKYIRKVLLESYNDWDHEYWVHYSNVPYLKVNYDPSHRDPIGLYFFPKDFKPRLYWRTYKYKFIVHIKDNINILDLSKLSKEDAINMLKNPNLKNIDETDLDRLKK